MKTIKLPFKPLTEAERQRMIVWLLKDLGYINDKRQSKTTA